MIALLLAGPAWAFCGVYAGSAESETPTNARSEAVLVRDGDTTTLTLAADVRGGGTDFALLLPVPEVLTPNDVRLVDPGLVDKVRTYGVPRAVVYDCDTALAEAGPTWAAGCAGALGCSRADEAFGELGQEGPQAETTVVVEAAFSVGSYELVVLSAEESADLWSWLSQNGYSVPEGGRDVLQSYLDQGVYFLAARVSLDAAPQEGDWLQPLQLRYTAAELSLPIRIGTISAEGEQEVLLHVFTGDGEGQVGIANVPEAILDHDCMWPADVSDFAAWYEARLGNAIGGDHGIGWIREHSWPVYSTQSNYHCDPCTPEGDFTLEELLALGASNAWLDVQYSRLRVRYLPQDVTEDLVLYTDGVTDVRDQSRFIAYAHELEFLFPVCDVGWAEAPGECPGARTSADARVTGCAAWQGPAGLLGGLLAVWSRRRRNIG